MKFGRTLKVFLAQPGLGELTIVDWLAGQPREGSEGKNFHVDFSIERHSRPEPQAASVTVQGLSQETRSKIVALHRAAEQRSFKDRRVLRSGQISIYGGYGEDAGLLFVGVLAPDGVSVKPGNPQPSITLKALDGRIEWEGRFVKKSLGPGVDLRTITGVLKAAGDYMSGADADKAFEDEFPELVKRRGGPTVAEGGFVLFGQSQRVNRMLCRDLGIQPFFTDGAVTYISRDTTILGEAIKYTRGGPDGDVLSLQEMPLGRIQITTLLDYRLRPGRQVQLVDDKGRSIGAGIFRADQVSIAGSIGGQSFHATSLLRPTVKGSA